MHQLPEATIWSRRKSEIHRMTSDYPTLNGQKYPIYTNKLGTPEVQILVRLTLRSTFFKIQGCRRSEMHLKTSELSSTLNCQSTLYTRSILTSQKTQLVCFSLRPTIVGHGVGKSKKIRPATFEIQGRNILQALLRYKVVENRKNRKFPEWPEIDLEHLTIKIILRWKRSYLASKAQPVLYVEILWGKYFIYLCKLKKWNTSAKEIFNVKITHTADYLIVCVCGGGGGGIKER